MAKKKKTKETEEEITIEEPIVEEKYPLVELVLACPTDELWVIYNLGRVGLLKQYEQEMKEYGVKDIEPTLTLEEFDRIIKGA